MTLKKSDNVYVLEETPQLKVLYTVIRDKATRRNEFTFYADRIIRILVEEGLNLFPISAKEITTVMDVPFNGHEFQGKICAVSILRAGDAMVNATRDVCRAIRIGKILIQRDESTAKPKLYYDKLPKDISERFVLLLDPMLATGGSAKTAINILKNKGVQEENIVFLNLISCPEGIKNFTNNFPKVKIVTGYVDEKLDSRAFILPGLGDFGDRYFGTD